MTSHLMKYLRITADSRHPLLSAARSASENHVEKMLNAIAVLVQTGAHRVGAVVPLNTTMTTIRATGLTMNNRVNIRRNV